MNRWRRIIEDRRKIFYMILGIVLLISFLVRAVKDTMNETDDETSVSLTQEVYERGINGVRSTSFCLFSFINEEEPASEVGELLLQSVFRKIPLHEYLSENVIQTNTTEDRYTYELIVQSEANDENMINEEGDVELTEGALPIEDTLTENMKIENENSLLLDENQISSDDSSGEDITGGQSHGQSTKFIPAKRRAFSYDYEELMNYETLVSNFFAIDKTTYGDEKLLNFENLMEKDMTIESKEDSAQILIYHTHSQEAFVDSIPGDESTTIVGAGEKLAGILREEYGYNVIHHVEQYDVPERDYAYSNAVPDIEKILKENPDIEVIIDLHRDGVQQHVKLVSDIQGRPTAQVMLFNGLSRTNSLGEIEYLYNPYIEDNLAFSFQLQLIYNEYYPGLTRKIYLKGYRYNMHFCPKTLLIELGAQTNTVEEIHNALDPLAHGIAMVLEGENAISQ